MRLETIAAVVLRWGVTSLLWKGTKCTFGVGLAKIWFYLCLTIVKWWYRGSSCFVFIGSELINR